MSLLNFTCDLMKKEKGSLYRCLADASYESIDGILLCEECKHAFQLNPSSITISEYWGKAYQSDAIKGSFTDMTEIFQKELARSTHS